MLPPWAPTHLTSPPSPQHSRCKLREAFYSAPTLPDESLLNCVPLFYSIPTARVPLLTNIITKPCGVSLLWICTSQIQSRLKSRLLDLFSKPYNSSYSHFAQKQLMFPIAFRIKPKHTKAPLRLHGRWSPATSMTAHISPPAWMPFSHYSASRIAQPPAKSISSVIFSEKPFPKSSVRIKGTLLCGRITSPLCLHKSTAQGCGLQVGGQRKTVKEP